MIVIMTFNQALLPHGCHFIFNEGQLNLLVKLTFTFLCDYVTPQISVSRSLENVFQKDFLKKANASCYRQNSSLTKNFIELDKKKLLKGKIIFGHCRGHDTIIIFFHFEGFYEQHLCLHSKSYYFR